MKIYKNMVSWGGPEDNWWHIWWYNYLPKNIRYLGFRYEWYDGPINSIGFWFFNIGWITYRFMIIPKEYRN